MDEKQYLSKEKYEELKARLEYLMSVERARVAKDLAYAASLGDRSENAEYHQARELQVKIEEEIAKITAILKTAVIVTDRHSDIIGVGSTVVIQKEGESQNREYHIVGSEEADMSLGKISHNSPLGSALMGKKKGDIAIFAAPNGEMKYVVVDIKTAGAVSEKKPANDNQKDSEDQKAA